MQEWDRVDGMIITARLEPQEIIDFLTKQQVVAQLDWFAQTPNMMGIRVVSADGHVGILKKGSTTVEPGPTMLDFIETTAEAFKAEVMIGDVGIDRLDEEFASLPEPPIDEETPLRVVEISDTPASAVPLMAAFNGVDIVELGLPGGKRALLAQLPAGRSNWTLGDVPLVTLTSTGDEFQAFLIEDDDPESIVTYNWGMEERIIAGAATGDSVADTVAQMLVGPREDVEAIHDAVPGVGRELAVAATQQRGTLATRSFVSALGLPADVASFLNGEITLDQVDGHLHQARGVSNAIGRSVDIMLGERKSDTGLWATYTSTVVEKPWLIPMVAAAEATVGLSLLVASRARDGKRTGIQKLGTALGVAMLIDSVGEISLAKYVRLRQQSEG